MEGIAKAEIERDEVTVERLARGLQGALVRRTNGEDVIRIRKVAYAMVLRRVGENECAAAEEADVGRKSKGKGGRYRARLPASVRNPVWRFALLTRSGGSFPERLWVSEITS